MDPSSLKIEFEKQIKDADVKITAAEKQLAQLNEYKTKLLGGLETIELLNPTTPTAPETQDAPTETSEPPAE
jgi:hypothetical protein